MLCYQYRTRFKQSKVTMPTTQMVNAVGSAICPQLVQWQREAVHMWFPKAR